MLPEKFSEQLLRIYCKKDDIRGIEMLKRVFADWCKQQGFPCTQLSTIITGVSDVARDIL